MYGVILAFKTYDFGAGIMGSPWIGLENFRQLLDHPEFAGAFANTLIISCGRLIFEFPIPIVLALFINEIRGSGYKRVMQTIYTFPHFLSWVIVYGLAFNLFSHDGIFNQLMDLMGLPSTQLLQSPKTFRAFLFMSDNWKEMGYGTIIYLAAITGISPELYEAGKIDGASRWQLMGYITWPSIKPTVAIMLVLTVAGMMNAGFDQIFNMDNAAVRSVSDIIDTLVFRLTFVTGSDFGFTTAMGLFKSVINLILMLIANKIVKNLTGRGIY
jgi:ABC-type polysaccharide transport system, permease component